MGIIPFELLCQEQNDEMEVSFTKIKLKDDNQFLGEMIKKTDSTVLFHDNVLGELTLLATKVKEIQEEDTSRVYLITLINGNAFNGKIVSKGKQQFDLKTNLGTLTLRADMVKDAEKLEVKSMVSKDYWYPNPNATRYFFAPSAIPIKKGDGYYQNAYLLANMANYGITSNFSFGGGVVLPFAAFITPKVGFEVAKNLYAGAGMLLGLLPEQTGAGIMYGLATYGNKENNITAGVGYGLLDGEFTKNPIITLNGMLRTSRKTAIVSENWMVRFDGEYQPLFSYGARFMWNRFTIDGAFLNNKEIFDSFIIGIPYIDFIVTF